MGIEEILKNAGIEDAEAIAKVKAEMPKAFMPLADANKRITAAKTEAADATKALEDYKAQQEQAQAQAKEGEDKQAQEFAALQEKYNALEGRFNDSQNAIKQRDAKAAITEALKGAGANPAALGLLADAGLSKAQFGEDGKLSNLDDVLEAVKGDNSGLFGEKVDTGEQQKKATDPNDLLSAFEEGFGDTTRR